jgi:signal transduction histidine kinase
MAARTRFFNRPSGLLGGGIGRTMPSSQIYFAVFATRKEAGVPRGTLRKTLRHPGHFLGRLGAATRAGQLYTTLLQANKAIQRASTVTELFEETCRLCTEFGSFDLAWTGVPGPEGGHVVVTAVRGPLQAYVEGLEISLDPASPWSAGITGRCFLDGRPTVCNDWNTATFTYPWRAKALAFGIRSSAAIPIHHQGRVAAAMTLYSRQVDFFLPDRMELLEEMGQDLSFALERLDREEELRQMNARLEARVQERTLQLEEANQELTAFAHSISHDLRTPLRHLTGFSDLLATQLGSVTEPKAFHYLGVIQAAAKRMNKLIDALLAYARTGQGELRVAPLDLNQIVAGVVEAFHADLGERTVHWVVEPLPRVPGDPDLIFLLVHNLVDNAVKFTRDQPEGVIEILPLQDPPGFLVRDNGAGFNPAQAGRLFGLFQRLHSEAEFPGTGLGLANAQRIAQRHGGRIRAEGEVGRGTTFYVTFPRQPGVSAE